MAVLLLSDLHLPVQPSALRDTFLAFLRGPARAAEAVYILGDLFEVWLGDDIGVVDHHIECAALAELSGAGVPLHVMGGNRDFLLGAGFAAATGARLMQDPTVVDLGGVPTLLSHGDAWCTDDHAYQRYRRITGRPWMQATFLALPRMLRRAIIRRLQTLSARHKQGRRMPLMDVNPQAIEDAFDRHRVTRMIHGHTHRPAEHRHGERVRIVLADWRPTRMEYLACDRDGCRRQRLAIPT